VSQRIGFLSHDEAPDSRPKTFVPKDVASLLLRYMVAERLRHNLIRAFPPKSVFLSLRGESQKHAGFGAQDPTGTNFRMPQSHNWRELHLPSTSSLRVRAKLSFKSWKHGKFGVQPVSGAIA
jgi:hypothetical protein